MSNHNLLKLMNWNSRSLNNKVAEFFNFVESNDIDIAVVTETWLRSHNSLYSPNYSTIRMDRQHADAERGGGVSPLPSLTYPRRLSRLLEFQSTPVQRQ